MTGPELFVITRSKSYQSLIFFIVQFLPTTKLNSTKRKKSVLRRKILVGLTPGFIVLYLNVKLNNVRVMANAPVTATATHSREDAFVLPDPDTTETSVKVSLLPHAIFINYNAM